MKSYNVKIKFEKSLSYDLTFNNRINFIVGNSATGKTAMTIPFKDNRVTSVKLNGIDIMREYAFNGGTDYVTVLALLQSSAKLVILDETQVVVDVLKRNKINKYLRNKIVVIISRDAELIFKTAIGGVTVGVQNFYQLKYDGENNVIMPYFTFDTPTNYSSIMTEDAKSGYLFMKHITNNVSSMSGKENLKKAIDENVNLVLVDLCGLNQMIYVLKVILSEFDIHVVDAYSFEWLVLKTRMFRCITNLSLDDYPDFRPNLEKYITEVLEEISEEAYKQKYSKGDEEYFNWLFSCGKEDLLKGTEYEYLLNTCDSRRNNKSLSIQERAKLLTEQ